MLKKSVFAVAALFILLAVPAQALPSSNSGNPEERIAKDMAKAEKYIKDEKYRRAIRVLKGVVKRDEDNAEAYNWLGYASRKSGKLDDAGTYYGRALEIDPNHRGALEYQGEYFLQTGQPEKAKENLSKLETICPGGCMERQALAEAIEAHETGKPVEKKSRW